MIDRLRIRRAYVDDSMAMYEISLRAHQASYSDLIPMAFKEAFNKRYTYSSGFYEVYQDRIRDRINQSSVWEIFVAEIDGEVVGYTIQKYVKPHYIVKKGLFVDPKFQGYGIGAALLTESINGIAEGTIVELQVIEKNDRAKKLYEKHNFQYIPQIDKTFYGAKLLVMQRRL